MPQAMETCIQNSEGADVRSKDVSGEADPIFAAIETHRRAYDARQALLAVHPEIENCDDIPGWEELDDAEMETWAVLTATAPTTLAGCRALAEHAVHYPEMFHSLPDENFERVFRSIAQALAALVPTA